MLVRGNHNDIESFYNAMSQKGNIYMGRGAEATLEFEDDDAARIEGWCKWSVQSALIDNAIDMKNNPNRWYWGEGTDPSRLKFITLWEACKRWSLDMEVYSEECGCCFQEHYVCIKGDVICDECVEYNEYCIDEFQTKEDAEAELGIKISDEEWNSGESFISRGGFENWDFEI